MTISPFKTAPPVYLNELYVFKNMLLRKWEKWEKQKLPEGCVPEDPAPSGVIHFVLRWVRSAHPALRAERCFL